MSTRRSIGIPPWRGRPRVTRDGGTPGHEPQAPRAEKPTNHSDRGPLVPLCSTLPDESPAEATRGGIGRKKTGPEVGLCRLGKVYFARTSRWGTVSRPCPNERLLREIPMDSALLY